MQLNRNPPATIGQSKLVHVNYNNRNVIDQTSVLYMERIIAGSKALCAAILNSGKLHGPLTEEQQIKAVEYAYNIKPRRNQNAQRY